MFPQDTLDFVVREQKWSWEGHEFESVRLASVWKSEVTRHEKAHRDYGTAVRGWTVCIVHLKVDGRLIKARLVGNAGYSHEPAGWFWEEALLYLGVGDHYDFVKRKVV